MQLKWWEIQQLEKQGCTSLDWNLVSISEGTDLSKLRNVYFSGPVAIGADVEIINVPGGISGVRIGDRVRIVNVSRIENKPEAPCGVGTHVEVLDETGGRPVIIYPGISAQMAMLMTRLPKFAESRLFAIVKEHIKSLPDRIEIGDDVEILDSGALTDIRIWPGIKVDGARRLHNGTITSSTDLEHTFSHIGAGVDAENFIIDDGKVLSGSILRNTYVGQGAVLDKGFAAHDSLFFSNCAMENGEACAMFGGPYTVSMHKSTLLIGCQTSFMNAGSATNLSNHMYKLGPMHWGVLERGVKTSSNSYLMLGAKIGAFSLLMGEHKAHPDSSEFPFSYLFGDPKGLTVVVPGIMLKSCGLTRDEQKWPNRDKRKEPGMVCNDRVNFQMLNPHTINHLLKAIEVIRQMLQRPADDQGYLRYKAMRFSRTALERGQALYAIAIYKFLHSRLGDGGTPAHWEGALASKLQDSPHSEGALASKLQDSPATGRWIDMAGQVMPYSALEDAMKAGSVTEIEQIFSDAEKNYDTLEKEWIAANLQDWPDVDGIYARKAAQFDAMVAEDRASSVDMIEQERQMLSLLSE